MMMNKKEFINKFGINIKNENLNYFNYVLQHQKKNRYTNYIPWPVIQNGVIEKHLFIHVSDASEEWIKKYKYQFTNNLKRLNPDVSGWLLNLLYIAIYAYGDFKLLEACAKYIISKREGKDEQSYIIEFGGGVGFTSGLLQALLTHYGAKDVRQVVTELTKFKTVEENTLVEGESPIQLLKNHLRSYESIEAIGVDDQLKLEHFRNIISGQLVFAFSFRSYEYLYTSDVYLEMIKNRMPSSGFVLFDFNHDEKHVWADKYNKNQFGENELVGQTSNYYRAILDKKRYLKLKEKSLV